MTELNCENVCLAALALLDGHEMPLTAGEIANHLSACPNCREEIAQQKALAEMLSAQKRRDYPEDVWAAISPTIMGTDFARSVVRRSRKQSAAATLVFVLLSVLLLSFRLAELLPKADPGLFFKFVPVLLVIAVFAYLKENPFKINASLRLEGE